MGPLRTAVLCLVLAYGCEEPSEEPQELSAAPEFFSDALESELDLADGRLRTRGFSRDSMAWRGFLLDGEAEVHEVSLQRGACKVFYALGSAEVRELSLSVHDAEGALVDSSAQALRICPTQSGPYFLVARASGSGLFSIRDYEGPAGLELRLEDLVTP